MINFDLGEELKLIGETMHDFAVNELRPVAREYEEVGKIDGKIIEKFDTLGIDFLDYPEEFGGLALDERNNAIINMELAYGDSALVLALNRPGIGGYLLDVFGSQEQKEKYFHEVKNKKGKFGFHLTNTGDPFDIYKVCLKYKQEGNDYILNGKGKFTHNFDDSLYIITLAVPEKDNLDFSDLKMFIIPSDSNGLVKENADDKLGLIAYRTGTIGYNNVKLSNNMELANFIDYEKQIVEFYKKYFLIMGAVLVGTGKAALDYAIDYSQERVAFGSAVALHQGLSFIISDMAIQVEGAENILKNAAWKLSVGKAKLPDIARALSFILDMTEFVTPNAIQVLGGHGYIKDHPVEKFARDSKTISLLCGSRLLVDELATKYLS